MAQFSAKKKKSGGKGEKELQLSEMIRQIDVLVKVKLVNRDELWDPQLRDNFSIVQFKIAFNIKTDNAYPITSRTYEVASVSLPRMAINNLRIALRGMNDKMCPVNAYEQRCERAMSSTGCYELEMTALHLAERAARYVKDFRKDPSQRTNREILLQTDKRLRYEGMDIAETL
ncbi:MAG: hypothetical protein Q9164_003805 [Protoblastenia rupestris]